MLDDVTFREARFEDIGALVALYADDDLGQTRETPQDEIDTAYINAFHAVEQDPNHQLLVGVQGGAVVATLQLCFLPGLSRRGAWRAQVEAMRVAKPLRGQGIGRLLLDWAVSKAKARGCRLVQLTSDRQRPDAHRFYENAGFEPSHVGFKRQIGNQTHE